MQIMSGSDIEEIQKAEEDPENDRFRPIPLDDKWFVKFGFKSFTPCWDKEGFQIKRYTNHENYGYNYRAKGVDHVHILQNIYSLMERKELQLVNAAQPKEPTKCNGCKPGVKGIWCNHIVNENKCIGKEKES